jgi:anthranilate synthase component 1
MYFPDEKLFLKLAEKGNLIPVYREFLADMETPVSAFRKIDTSPFGFLLESVERGGNIGRYSFLGSDPRTIFRSRGRQVTLIQDGETTEYSVEGNPLDELARLISKYKPVELPELHRFTGGAVGYIAYDVIQYIEDIPQRNEDDLLLPELYFLITDTVLIFDHVNRTLKVVSNAVVDSSPRQAYREAIARIDRVVGFDGQHVRSSAGPGSPLSRHQAGVQAGGPQVERIHSGGGHHSGCPLPEAGDVVLRSPVRRVPVAAGDQPFPLHVLSQV